MTNEWSPPKGTLAIINAFCDKIKYRYKKTLKTNGTNKIDQLQLRNKKFFSLVEELNFCWNFSYTGTVYGK